MRKKAFTRAAAGISTCWDWDAGGSGGPGADGADVPEQARTPESHGQHHGGRRGGVPVEEHAHHPAADALQHARRQRMLRLQQDVVFQQRCVAQKGSCRRSSDVRPLPAAPSRPKCLPMRRAGASSVRCPFSKNSSMSALPLSNAFFKVVWPGTAGCERSWAAVPAGERSRRCCSLPEKYSTDTI